MTAPALRPSLPTRPLMLALYVLAAAFALPSIMEFMLVTFPFDRFGQAQVRFGAVGLIFNTVAFSPLVGLAIALFAAVQLDHRRVARTISVVLLVMAVLLLVAAPFWILDFLQLRPSVNPQMKRAFDWTSAKAGVTGGIMFLTALSLGIAGWRTTRLAAKKAPARAAARPAPSSAMVSNSGGAAGASQV